MKLECHLKWFRTTSTIEGLGGEVEHINSCTAYDVHIFNTLGLISARKNTAMENSFNVSLRLTSFYFFHFFLQKLFFVMAILLIASSTADKW